MAVEQINLASESDGASLRAFESQQEQTIALELARLAEILGVGVMCYDLRSGQKIASTDDGLLPVIPPELMWQCVQSGASRVLPLASGLVCFALPFPAGEMAAHVAVGYVLSKPGLRPADLVFAAAERGWSQPELDRWLAKLPYCQPEMLRRHVALAADDLRRSLDHSVESTDSTQI